MRNIIRLSLVIFLFLGGVFSRADCRKNTTGQSQVIDEISGGDDGDIAFPWSEIALWTNIEGTWSNTDVRSSDHFEFKILGQGRDGSLRIGMRILNNLSERKIMAKSVGVGDPSKKSFITAIKVRDRTYWINVSAYKRKVEGAPKGTLEVVLGVTARRLGSCSKKQLEYFVLKKN